MADSQTQQPADTTQQVTSKTPTTSQKNPKRVAAGKATAEKTKQAHKLDGFCKISLIKMKRSRKYFYGLKIVKKNFHSLKMVKKIVKKIIN